MSLKPVKKYDKKKANKIGREVLDFLAKNHLEDCVEIVVALDNLSQFFALSCGVKITEEMRKQREPQILEAIKSIEAEESNLVMYG